jgi:thiol-disulfide isomerase/thioredoxin
MVTLQAAIAALALSGVGQTVLLDFYSDSCGPCREMNPTVQAMIDAGYPVERVNVTKNARLAARYGVQRIPCFVMVVSGREVDRAVGLTSQRRLEQMCKAGVSAASVSRSPPMLARDNAPRPQPTPPSASWPPAASASNSLNEPWNPSIPPQPVVAPLKPAAVSDAALLAASVRVRIEDPDGRSCGSGTIIDNRGKEALVLTCGHIFRDSQGHGRITIDLFAAGSSEPQQVEGRLVSYDLTRDVGLVAIHTPGPVAAARLAPPDYRITRGMPVASAGCNNGDPPTVRRSQINSLDKFQGPPNLQVAGQPVEGRSGGGLFSAEGYVIGVCNAADPSDREGLFAAPGSIYAELDRADLAFVYKSPSGNLDTVPAAAAPVPPTMPGPLSASTDLASLNPPPAVGPGPSMVVSTSAIEPAAGLAPHEQAALDEIRRREKEGAEIVIIVRPRGNSEAKSDVIVLDHASSACVRQLSDESRRQASVRELAADGNRQDRRYQNETSLELPKPRKILLEWSKPVGAP